VYAQSRGAYGVRGSAVVAGPRGVGRAYYAPARFYSPYYAFRPRFNFGFGLWLGYPVAYSAGFYAPYYSYPYYDPYYYGAPYPYPYPYPYPNYYPYPYGGPAYGGPAPAYPPNGYPPNGYPPNGYPSNPYPPGTTPPPSSATPPSRYSNPSSNPNYPSRSVSVDAQRDMGGFSFEVSPSAAEIYVDGQYVGTVGEFTPRSQPLGVQAGHHRVEIRADGYRTMQFDADVVAGQVLPYQGAMQR
jgi:PEGA domain-containing protein